MQSSLPELILPIKLEKSEERLTSLGGLVVLEEMAQALKVWQRVDKELAGPGSGRGIGPANLCSRWYGCCTREGGGWKTCGNCGPNGRCWRAWGCGRCRLRAR